MIKDVMVRLDGSPADELRLAAVSDIANRFEAHVIGLYFNTLPMLLTEDEGASSALDMLERAPSVQRQDAKNRSLSNRPRTEDK